MGIDVSAVARGTGVTTKFQDLKTGTARFLPQRVALFAQGEEGVTYSTDKFQVTGGPAQVGAALGYRSPAYVMARELLPAEGGGLGTVTLDMFPLAKGAGATPAVGAYGFSATAVSKATAFYARVGGFDCNRFTVPKLATVTAEDISDVYESLRQSIEGKLGVPCFVAHTYGSPTATAASGNTGDGTVTGMAVSASGTPRAGTSTLECVAAAAGAGTFRMLDPAGFTVATGIEVGVAQVDVAGLDFTITAGAADYVVGDTFAVEVPSTGLEVTSSWNGASANDLTLQMVGDASTGVTWAITTPTGGATNPDVQPALDQIGPTWNTIICSQFTAGAEGVLDSYQTWGGNPDDETGRWAPTTKKPAIAIMASTESTVADATVVTATRTDDNVNHVINVPGSPDIPYRIAAEAVGKIASRANNNPPYDYGSIELSRTTPGGDSVQWDYGQRDAAVKRGCGTTLVNRSGRVDIHDVVSMYAPEGEEPPAYRFAVDTQKLMNATYNVSLEFDSDKWDGRPLIPNGQPTTNPLAVNPSMAKGAMGGILDGLGLAAIISDPAAAKEATTAAIDSSNPKRLNIQTTFAVAGNANIRDITQNFGFYFGG
jgi:phage tail sheath gpL-like